MPTLSFLEIAGFIFLIFMKIWLLTKEPSYNSYIIKVSENKKAAMRKRDGKDLDFIKFIISRGCSAVKFTRFNTAQPRFDKR